MSLPREIGGLITLGNDTTTSKSFVRRNATRLAHLALRVGKTLLWRQGNQFGFVVRKVGKYKPWIAIDEKGEPMVDLEYIGKLYDASKYPGVWGRPPAPKA